MWQRQWCNLCSGCQSAWEILFIGFCCSNYSTIIIVIVITVILLLQSLVQVPKRREVLHKQVISSCRCKHWNNWKEVLKCRQVWHEDCVQASWESHSLLVCFLSGPWCQRSLPGKLFFQILASLRKERWVFGFCFVLFFYMCKARMLMS